MIRRTDTGAASFVDDPKHSGRVLAIRDLSRLQEFAEFDPATFSLSRRGMKRLDRRGEWSLFDSGHLSAVRKAAFLPAAVFPLLVRRLRLCPRAGLPTPLA
jgi:hypothetical protein